MRPFAAIGTLVLVSLVSTVWARKKIEMLGLGFSDFDGIYDEDKLRLRVLDLGELQKVGDYKVPSRVQYNSASGKEKRNSHEKGFDQFTATLQASMSARGSFSTFKSSVEAQFSSKVVSQSDYYFSRLTNTITVAQLRVDTRTPSVLRKYVIPNVKNELETADPGDLFQRYGTHVVTGVVLGGKLELWSSAEGSQFETELEFSTAVDASYKGLVKGSASLSGAEQQISSHVQSKRSLKVTGGKMYSGENGERDWEELVYDGDAEAIDFVQSGAVPIWDLVESPKQAASIKQYYRKKYGASIILKRFDGDRLGSGVKSRSPNDQVIVPDKWKVVSGGAKVKYYGAGQFLTRSRPMMSDGGDYPIGWAVKSADILSSDAGYIQAYAVAIWDPQDEWDVKVTSTRDRARFTSAKATVNEGYTLVGGGVDVDYSGPGNVVIESYPDGDTWVGKSKERAKKDRATLTTYAIGLRNRAGGSLKVRRKNATEGPSSRVTATASATAGYALIGGGAAVSRGTTGHLILDMFPSSGGHEFSASSKDRGLSDKRSLTVHMLEAKGATFVQDEDSVSDINPTDF